jgi:hypothetical protein
MRAGRPGRKRGRTSESKRKSRQPRNLSKGWRPLIVDRAECGESGEIDKLLVSSLRFWEVERDLIEERLAARKSVKAHALQRPDIAA